MPSRSFLQLPFFGLFLWFSEVVLEDRGGIIIKVIVVLVCYVFQS